MISSKTLLYTLIFSCFTFVYAATQSGFIGMSQSPIQVPLLLSIGYLALTVTFFMSMKDMSTKLKVAGSLYCLAGLVVSFVVMSPFFAGKSSFSFFPLLYPAGLVMLGTFYVTYFWIAIRANMTVNAAIVLGVLSLLMTFWPGQALGSGTPPETNIIGFPALVVSLIAYFRAKSVIKARTASAK